MSHVVAAFLAVVLALPAVALAEVRIQTYDLPTGGGSPHDVAVGADGIVWYTAQRDGKLGRLDPTSGKVDLVSLGRGAAPHGVVIGPDGAPWVTEGGTNAIVRVDPQTREVKSWPLPEARGYVNLNTLTFDKRGRVWFTGQNGIYGRLDPRTGEMKVWDAPRGRGPYGIATTPDGAVYYASLAGSHIARVDLDTGAATVVEPPTKGQGARRVWSDSKGRVWVSEWNSGHVSRYDPKANAWKGALRSRDREVRDVPERPPRCQRPPDPRPPRRGVGAGIRRRPARRLPHEVRSPGDQPMKRPPMTRRVSPVT